MNHNAFSTTREPYSPSPSSTYTSLHSEDYDSHTLPLALRRAGSLMNLAEFDAEYTLRMSSLETTAATPSPNIKDILSGPKFTGGSASRWLRQLKAQLISAGYDTVPPAVHARTIDLLIDVSISEVFEDDATYQKIVNNYEGATDDDVKYMEDLIKQYYPDVSTRVKVSPSDQLDALAQERSETLESYYNRVLALLRQFGGRDARGTTVLTAIELNTLRMLVKAFIKGIHSTKLRSEASKKGALTATSLHAAYNLIVDAQHQLDLEEQEEKEAQVSEKAKAYDALLRGRTAQQVASALLNTNSKPRSGPYVPPPARPQEAVAPLHMQPQNQYQNQPQLQSQYQNNQSQNQNQGNVYTGYANPPPPGYVRPAQNNGYGRGAGGQGQYGTDNTPARGSYNGGGYGRGYSNNGSGYGGGNGSGRNRLPETNPAMSNHPIVNGSQPFYREMGLLCPKCGEIGHRQDTCVGPELQAFEQYILRGKIREVVAQANASGDARANHVNLHVQAQGQEPYQYRYNNQPPVEEREQERTREQEPDLQEEVTIEQLRALGLNHHVQGASVELIVPGELPEVEGPKKSKKSKKGKGKAKEKKISLQAYLGEGKRGASELTEEELEREFVAKVLRLDIYDPGQHVRPTIQEQYDAYMQPRQPPVQPIQPQVQEQQSRKIHATRQQTAPQKAPQYISPYAQSEPEPVQEVRRTIPAPVQPVRYVPPPAGVTEPVFTTAPAPAPAVTVAPVHAPAVTPIAVAAPAPAPVEVAPELPVAPLVLPIRKKRVNKQLKQIVGRLGLDPISYKDVMQDFKVTLSLMDLMQISPDFAKNVRQLSTRTNDKKKKRQLDPSAMMACITLSANHLEALDAGSSTLHPAGYPRFIPVQSDDKAFRIPAKSRVTLDGKLVVVNLKGLTCVADQGSDINIVTYSIVQTLGLETYMVSPRKDFALHMGTADGKTSPLTRFTIMTIGVNGIWRQIYAFIRPTGSTDRHLLLGLPWLHDVNALIDIRASTISIGDSDHGEVNTVIQGPAYALLTSHKLTLAPLDPKYKNWVAAANVVGGDLHTDVKPTLLQGEPEGADQEDTSDSEGSEDSDSEGSESGSETDTETASTILAGNSGN